MKKEIEMMAFMFVEFTGPCCLCGGKSTSKRGGVGSDERGGIMCCPCAVTAAPEDWREARCLILRRLRDLLPYPPPLPAARCCVCERPFQPVADKGIYCSSRCAWNSSADRSPESMRREAEALRVALGGDTVVADSPKPLTQPAPAKAE